MIRRLRIIENCLTSTTMSVKDLQKKVKEEMGKEFELRTIQNDLHVLTDCFGIKLESVGRGYYYADPLHCIFRKDLSKEEKDFLKGALETMGQFKGLPKFGWFDNMKKYLDVEENERPIIEYSHMFENEDAPSKAFLPRLFLAISEKRTVELSYQAYTYSKPRKQQVFPYLLKEYNDRWYLICSDVDAQNENVLKAKAIDRIKDFKEVDSIPYEEPKVDFDEYFDDFIGVSDNGNKEVDVVFCVNPLHHIDDYIESKPLHSSQSKVVGEELSVLISKYPQFKDWTFCKLKAIRPNVELYQSLVSYYGNLVVISPVSVRNKIKEKTKKLMSYYDSL